MITTDPQNKTVTITQIGGCIKLSIDGSVFQIEVYDSNNNMIKGIDFLIGELNDLADGINQLKQMQ